MEPDDPAGSAALRWLDPAMDASAESGAEAAVGALYRAPVNDTYGLGGVILARTAPVWVDLSSAAL